MGIKIMLKRICAITILICMILCAPSCATTDSSADTSTVRVGLSVEPSECIYSDDFSARISARITDIIGELLWKSKQMTLTDVDKTEISEYLTLTVFPICQDIPVYPEELEDLITLVKDQIKSENTDVKDVCNIYINASALLGYERNGALIYEGTRLYLERELAKNEDYFKQLGYPWYEKNIATLTEQLNILQNSLGQESFTEIINLFFLCSGALSGAITTGLEGNIVTDREISIILGEYLSHIDALDISEEHWALAAKLIEGIELEKLFGNTLLSKAIKNMRQSEYLQPTLTAMPQLISLLVAISENISEEDIAAMREGSSNIDIFKNVQVRDEFLALDAKLRSVLPDGTAIESAIFSAGLDGDYTEFLSSVTPNDANELIYALNSEESLRSETIRAYVFSLSPALAFLAFRGETNEGA